MNRALLRVVAPALIAGAGLVPVFTGSDASSSRGLEEFVFRRGDRICLVGGVTAERMQHHGHFETRMQNRFPELGLVFRNLGFSADELTVRQRTSGFLSEKAAFELCKANVVIAMYGFNESFGGEAGLPKFRKDLREFAERVGSTSYDGSGRPARVILCTPTAYELKPAPMADASVGNRRLAPYAAAVLEVGEELGLPALDLFTTTLELFGKVDRPMTINGYHLTDAGNAVLARVIERELLGEGLPAAGIENLAKIQEGVLEKNFHWHQRYRVTDGFNVYGGRSNLTYDGTSNYDVLQRELQVLDVMTANRDRRIHARARGQDLEIDDSNTPEFLGVETNAPGPNDDGTYNFLDGETAISKMTLGSGLEVELFASEKDWPELRNPVQMSFDTQGRLWVACWPTYTHWTPKEPVNDALIVLEDTDGDGKADQRTVFDDELHNPTGFEFFDGGVLVAQVPDLLFLKDTDGDGRADVRQRVLHGLSSGDTHHSANSFVMGPDGWLYFQEGTFHMSQVETPWGPVRNRNGCVWRFNPRSYEVERFVPVSFANPHGHAVDAFGQHIVHDGTTSEPFHALLYSGHLQRPDMKHPKGPKPYARRTRPCPGTETLSSTMFPAEYQQNLLVGNVIGFLGILRYRIDRDGGTFKGTELEPMIQSEDPNFRPSDLEIGPDGALWFLDWHNPLIGHMQHHIRDPNRDNVHGRIYRVSPKGPEPKDVIRVDGRSVGALIAMLDSPEDRVRYRVRIELSEHDPAQVVKAADKWLAERPQDARRLIETLWVHQRAFMVDEVLLRRGLAHGDARVRAASLRVLRDWRDELPSALDLILAASDDDDALVRCEAVVHASFFADRAGGVEALRMLLEFDAQGDPAIAYAQRESLRAFDDLMSRQLAEQGESGFEGVSERGIDMVLSRALPRLSIPQLSAMPPGPRTDLALLRRPGLPAKVRSQALDRIAERGGRGRVDAVLAAIDEARGTRSSVVLEELAPVLVSLPIDELRARKERLDSTAEVAPEGVVRAAALAACFRVDGRVDANHETRDLLAAIEMLEDEEVLGSANIVLLSLMTKLRSDPREASIRGQYVRIDIPKRRATLTLAEVEVFSAGKNVSLGKPARQNAVKHGGVAGRAVDGDNNPSYSSGTQTHTPENGRSPWWEVDLGESLTVDGLRIWNRQEGLGGRLEGFRVQVLDSKRRVVWERRDQPAPDRQVMFEIVSDVTAQRRQARKLLLRPDVLSSGAAAVVTMLLGDLQEANEVDADVAYRQELVKDLSRALAAVDPQSRPGLQGVADAMIAEVPAPIDEQVLALGAEVFARDSHCATCHQPNGQGLAQLYPPLVGSPWVTGSEERLIKLALHGLWGEIEVNGVTFKSPPMPPMTGFKDLLSDEELAAVLTYVRNSWGNRASAIEPATVRSVRTQVGERASFWKPSELLKLHPLESR